MTQSPPDNGKTKRNLTVIWATLVLLGHALILLLTVDRPGIAGLGLLALAALLYAVSFGFFLRLILKHQLSWSWGLLYVLPLVAIWLRTFLLDLPTRSVHD
jgi:hypothetical protein